MTAMLGRLCEQDQSKISRQTDAALAAVRNPATQMKQQRPGCEQDALGQKFLKIHKIWQPQHSAAMLCNLQRVGRQGHRSRREQDKC